MNLQYALPCGFRIGNIEVGLETGTLFWLDLIEDMEGGATLQRLDRAILYIRKNGRELYLSELSAADVRAIYDKILWFMSGGKEQKQTSGRSLSGKQEKLLSYSQDFDYIYSAFMQVYGIDLFGFIRVENGRNIYTITDVVNENDQIVTADYTITPGKNAMSAGPITFSDGVSLTIPTGSVWTIV